MNTFSEIEGLVWRRRDMKNRIWQYVFLLLLVGVTRSWGAERAVTQVDLVLSAESARPGETVWAGVHIQLADEWHTYWRYGGEAAQPPSISWDLPEGITAGEIHWPVPEKLDQNGVISYVYHHDTMLLVPFSISNAMGDLSLKGELRWLECKEACVPRNQSLSATLKVEDKSVRSTAADLIDEWRRKVPPVDDALSLVVDWDGEGVDDERAFRILQTNAGDGKLVDFYPHAYDDFEVIGSTETVVDESGRSGIKKKVFKYDGAWPAQIAGLVVIEQGEPASTKYLGTVLNIGLVSTAGGGDQGREQAGSEGVAATSQVSTLRMLFFAFVGGFILNFMPCVLPVIALKILGFVKQSQETPAVVKRLGLVYAAGVLFSFLVLASLVVGVQQAGHLASWGMQFQNLGFLIPMMVLVTLVALNFFGVFEISLGGGAMGVASRLSTQEGYAGAFFNGVLATILATPCTAPFLATALGFAFAQPPLWIVLFFVTIALGLALPYVVLSWNPKLMKYLPKPGPWMGRFKVAMGFPMIATAIWLYSVSLSHFGDGAELWLGLLLVVVALAAWVWGQFVQQVAVRKPLSIGVALLIGFGGGWWILERELQWRSPIVPSADEAGSVVEKGIEWMPWSHAAVAKARAEGHPVLVDFTAKWCYNCQANKRFSIEIDSVKAKLKDLNAVTFRADFTHYDPLIAKELEKFDRAGVPLVLVFPPGDEAEADVLPPLLTPNIVLTALDKAGEMAP